jgi:hypothetical protein
MTVAAHHARSSTLAPAAIEDYHELFRLPTGDTGPS